MEVFTNKTFLDFGSPCQVFNNVLDQFQREQSLKNELRVRFYYECKRCFDQGGFALFDTLTYTDYDLVHFNDLMPFKVFTSWDYPCCKVSDLQNFFKRLRKILDINGYVVQKNLKYIAVSEYGDVNKTFRPHYHLVLLSNVPGLHADKLSSFVSASWSLGKTDGLRPHGLKFCSSCPLVGYCQPNHCLYQNWDYVLNNRVFNDTKDLNKLTNYVLKYITKNHDWIHRLQRRVDIAFSLYQKHCDRSSKDGSLEYRRFKRNIMPFYLVSNNFGLAALDYLDHDKLLSDGVITMPLDNQGKVLTIPLSQYYKRKLCYKLVKRFDGKWCWRLKFEKLSQIVDLTLKRLKKTAYKFISFDDSLDFKTAMNLAKFDIIYKGVVAPVRFFFLPPDKFLRYRLFSDTISIAPNNNILPEHVFWQNVGDSRWSALGLVKYRRVLFSRYKSGYYATINDYKNILPSGVVLADELPMFRFARDWIDRYYKYMSDQQQLKLNQRFRNDSNKIALWRIGFVNNF